MVTDNAGDLARELERLRQEISATAPAEVAAAFAGATAELIRSGVADRALRPGDDAPDFTLPDAVGRPYRLADGLRKGAVVLTFYRGAW
jgi:hypothetical protein